MKKLLLTFIIGIFLISFASAWLPTVSTNEELKRDKVIDDGASIYPAISIDDWFGLGKNLFTGVLTSHTSECSNDCKSIIHISLSEESALVDAVKFETINYDERGNEIDRVEQPIRGYQFYIQDGERIVEDYEYQCEGSGIYENGTELKNCALSKIGEHAKPIWKEYNVGDVMRIGDYVLKLTANKKPDRVVDWKIETQGEWIDEWSTWGIRNITVDAVSPQADTSYGGNSLSGGMKFITNKAIILINATVQSAVDANRMYLWNGSKKVLATAVITGGVATFNNYQLTAGTSYYLVVNNSDNSNYHDAYYNHQTPYPKGATNINWTACYFQGGEYTNDYTNVINYMTTTEAQSQITLDSPSNNYISPTLLVGNFNATVIVGGGATFVNQTLFTNATGWAIANTTTTQGKMLSYTFQSDGKYIWGFQACDSDNACGVSENRTITVDSAYPQVSIIYPSGALPGATIGQNFSLNFSASDLNLGTCLRDYNGANTTLSCTANSTFIYSGNNTIRVWANDTAGNLNSSSVTFTPGIIVNNIVSNPITLISSNESFFINVYGATSAKINYNGTIRTATLTDNIANISFIVPSAVANYTFYWILDNGIYNTSVFYQNTTALQEINVSNGTCAAGLSTAFYFDFKDEQNLSSLTDTNVNYNIQYGTNGNNLIMNTSGSFTNIKNISICINSSISNYYVGYGEIQYQINGYTPRRFYLFANTRFLNTTINHTLYSLLTGSATAFQITASDTTLNPYTNYYVSLLRWYPALNTYNIVDMGKTDAQGQTVLYTQTNDVDYRLGLYANNGTLVNLLDPIRMVCQTTPCIYEIITALDPLDFTSFINIQSNLSFDKTTKVFTYIYNDPSQDTSLMNLTVYKDSGDGSTIICSTSSTDFTGVLSCNVSGYTGRVRALVYRSSSPGKPIASLIEEVWTKFTDAGGSNLGLILGLFLAMLVALAGIFNPPIAIILTVISLIPLIFFGALSPSIIIIIACLGGIVLHFMRRVD